MYALSQLHERESCRRPFDLQFRQLITLPGPLSPSRATAYSTGIRKTLISSRENSPPTMTSANGRCESEPTPVENAAGSRPSAATSAVIIIGRSRSSAASCVAS